MISLKAMSILFFTVLLAGSLATASLAQKAMSHGSMDHSAHKNMMNSKNSHSYKKASYKLPDVVLSDQNGHAINLKDFLTQSEPYALNFIFTTCTTICPILTASFSHMQHELGKDVDELQLISITIDPEYDTPGILKKYAKKVGATKNWTFLTGDYESIIALEKAFEAYTADKMNHRPTYFFKMKTDSSWVRVDGLASGSDLAEIYKLSSLF